MDQKTLERYISRVIQLQEERSERLDEAELESIALDLGLSLDELRQSVAAHLQRGRGYMKQSLWDDAIKELREAESLAPGNVEVVMTLAEAHAQRWAASDFVDDKSHAQKLARAALDLDPNHQPAFELLGRLERGPEAAGASKGTGAAAGVILGIGFGGVVLLTLLGGIVGWFVLSTRDEPNVIVKEVIAPPVTVETPAEIDESGSVQPSGGEPGSRDLELQIAGPAADQLELDVRKSRLDVYENSSFYTLRAVLKNVGSQEIEKIETVIELLDDSGETLHRDDPSLLWGYQPAIRPGDLSPVNLTQRASPAVSGVRLTIKLIDGTPGAKSYPPSQVIEPKMGAKFPAHLSVEVRERKAGFRPSGSSGKGYFKAEFEVKNTSDAAIKKMKLQLDLYSKDGKLLETKTGILAYSMTPSIHPGETWLEGFIAQVESSYDRYELTIVEME